MKSITTLFLLSLLATALFQAGCSSSQPSTSGRLAMPVVELSGTTNAPITGYYIEDGRRMELSGVLPMTISAPGLSQLAVRRLNSDDILVLTARGRNGSVSQTLRPKLDEGIRVLLDSLSLSSIPPQESLAAPTGERVVLIPYWYEGTWVFDDPARGLEREPFVAGIPEMIDTLVRDISDARDGFRLTCSATPFPKYQQKLIWVRADGGGNFYRLERTTKEGWLGPVMFRYFTRTPKVLYLKAESRKA